MEYGLTATQSTANDLKNLVADRGPHLLGEVGSQPQQVAWIRTGTAYPVVHPPAGWMTCVVSEMVSGTWSDYTLTCECQDVAGEALAPSTRYLARRTGDSSTGVARWVVAGQHQSGWVVITPNAIQSDAVGGYATNGRITVPDRFFGTWTDGLPCFVVVAPVYGASGSPIIIIGNRYWGSFRGYGTTLGTGGTGDPIFVVQGEVSLHNMLQGDPSIAVTAPSGTTPAKISLSWTKLRLYGGSGGAVGSVGYALDTIGITRDLPCTCPPAGTTFTSSSGMGMVSASVLGDVVRTEEMDCGCGEFVGEVGERPGLVPPSV